MKRAAQLLGVAPDADEATVRRAYKKMAREAHPDRPGGDVQQAYETFSRVFLTERAKNDGDSEDATAELEEACEVLDELTTGQYLTVLQFQILQLRMQGVSTCGDFISGPAFNSGGDRGNATSGTARLTHLPPTAPGSPPWCCLRICFANGAKIQVFKECQDSKSAKISFRELEATVR
jgi:hypothetical protein